jgi:hypothetical protein
MPKSVAVAEAYEHHVQNVLAVAEAAFERNTATYRRLVAAMAESGGTLPPAEADELVRVCETLRIPPERLGDDAATIAAMRDLETQGEAVRQRNAERKQPLPRLESDYLAAKAEWSRVHEECSTRLAAAQHDLTQKRMADEKLFNTRDESTERIEIDALRLRERNAHLFGPVSREQLQRIVRPAGERVRL